MHKTLLYATYWTLLAAGVLHFTADVLSQYFRGLRKPSYETTLYYGLHSAYALGQVVFALVALHMLRNGSTLIYSGVGTAISFVAVLGWLAISLLFIEYTPPKVFIAVVLVLLVAATVVG